MLHTAKRPEPEIPAKIDVPDFAHRLPEPIQRFTTKGVYDDEETHLSFTQGAGHGGSHPHLVHEFVSALAEDASAVPGRPPLGELDVRRPVRARVRAQGRRARPPARVHPATRDRRLLADVPVAQPPTWPPKKVALVALALVVAGFLAVEAAGDLRQFTTVTLNGLTLAALYFVVASGFTLIFGLMRVVNMAHGSLYLLGGYIALEVQSAVLRGRQRPRPVAERRVGHRVRPAGLDRPADRGHAADRRASASRCSRSSCAGTRARTCARR